MKKTLLIVISIFGLMVNGVIWAIEMPALAKKYECNSCHDIDKVVVGPPWMEVSKRYRGVTRYKYSKTGSAASDAQAYPLLKGLVIKVSQGGSGNWGPMPMSGNDLDRSNQSEIRQLVQFILNLAK